MSELESELKRWLLKELNKRDDCLFTAWSTDITGRRDTLDAFGCVRGQLYVIEFKRSRGAANRSRRGHKMQDHILNEWRNAGAKTLKITSREEGLSLLQSVDRILDL